MLLAEQVFRKVLLRLLYVGVGEGGKPLLLSCHKELEETGWRAGSSVRTALKLIMEKACEDSLPKVFKFFAFLKHQNQGWERIFS